MDDLIQDIDSLILEQRRDSIHSRSVDDPMQDIDTNLRPRHHPSSSTPTRRTTLRSRPTPQPEYRPTEPFGQETFYDYDGTSTPIIRRRDSGSPSQDEDSTPLTRRNTLFYDYDGSSPPIVRGRPSDSDGFEDETSGARANAAAAHNKGTTPQDADVLTGYVIENGLRRKITVKKVGNQYLEVFGGHRDEGEWIDVEPVASSTKTDSRLNPYFAKKNRKKRPKKVITPVRPEREGLVKKVIRRLFKGDWKRKQAKTWTKAKTLKWAKWLSS